MRTESMVHFGWTKAICAIIVVVIAIASIWFYFVPRSGGGKLSIIKYIPFVSISVHDDESGRVVRTELLFSSIDATTGLSAEIMKSITGKGSVDKLTPRDGSIQLERYSVDEPLYTISLAEPSKVNGILGNDILRNTIRHSASYITFNISKGTWRLGTPPYLPKGGATAISTHELLIAEVPLYGIDLRINGKNTVCLLDTTFSGFLTVPQDTGRAEAAIEIGGRQAVGTQVSANSVTGLAYPEVPHIGLQTLPFHQVTIDMTQNKLFLEND